MSIVSTGTSDWERPATRLGRAAYSVQEVAEQLGICQASVYRALKRGNLASVLIGGRRLIPALSINKLLTAEPTTDTEA